MRVPRTPERSLIVSSPPPELSVVLVNHNGADCLTRALRALHANTATGAVEYVVVDSASSDGSWLGLESTCPGTRVMRYDENIGFCAGCNRGAEVARGRLVAFVNFDGEVEPGWDGPLRGLLDDRSVQIATGLLLTPDGRTLQAIGMEVAPNMAVYGVDAFRPRDVAPDEPLEVNAATGALMMVRRDEFLASGGFYEPLWMYGEEADYCLRALERGRIVLHPESALRHDYGHASGPHGSPIRLYWSTRNRLINAARHLPVPTMLYSAACSLGFDMLTLVQARSWPVAKTLARAWGDGLRRMPAEHRARSPKQRLQAADRIVSLRKAVNEQRRISRLWGRLEVAS
jgi:GT2 family glycosyltransferase